MQGITSKSEIEKNLSKKGEYMQIDYLTKLLREELPLDARKFVLFKLAEIHKKKKMFVYAGKMYESLAKISLVFSEKIKNYVEATKLYIVAGDLDKADYAMKSALNEANNIEKNDIYNIIKEFYKKQAEKYEQELKRNHAIKIYEKLLEMNLGKIERMKIKEKLVYLYEKTGKLKEFYAIKKFEEREF